MLKTIIIDDEKRSIEMLEWLLESYCPEVEVVFTSSEPKEGLERIKELKPDLIFVDIQMPGMTGFSLLSELKDDMPNFILITAYNGLLIDRMAELKVPHLLKPIDHEDLLLRIAEVSQNTSIRNQQAALEELNTIF